MALTYDESNTLMNDPAFRGRIRVALLHFSNYVMGESPSTPAHNTRYGYAQQAMRQPDIIAQQLQPNVVMDSQVQTDGGSISDAALQTSVENTINNLI